MFFGLSEQVILQPWVCRAFGLPKKAFPLLLKGIIPNIFRIFAKIMRWLPLYILLISILLLAQSCRNKYALTPASKASIAETAEKETTIDKKIIIQNPSLPNTAEIEADLDVKSEKFSQNLSAKIKFIKGDTTWISLTGLFGIEGARILITKDTFQLLDRINKKYIKEHISLSKRLLPLNLDLHALQCMVMGYISYPIDSSFYASSRRDTMEYEKNQNNLWCKTAWKKNTLIDLVEKDLHTGMRLHAVLEDHQIYTVPFKRMYTLSDQQTEYFVDFKITSCEVNVPIDFRFDVSSKYERISLSN